MRFVFIGIIASFAFSYTRTQEVKNYYRSFSSSEDLYNFYHYDKDATPDQKFFRNRFVIALSYFYNGSFIYL
jgi:hypothetical protein